MNRIIVPTGYMGSGSSAITDLISEFKDCQNSHKSYEYVLLHTPNGLFDLEDKLLIGNNAIRSDEAIRSFEQQMKKFYNKKFWWVGNYEKIIGPQFMEITNQFINNIQEFKFDGYWYMHEELNFKMFVKLLLQKPFKILSRNKIKFKRVLRYNDGMRISYIKKDEFYKQAHNYIYDIIDYVADGKENIILDQFLLPFNLHRVDNYFDDKLKVIVVERDPRDVFILNKYIWPQKNIVVPMPKEANEFCKFYKHMRESEIMTHSDKVLRIKFEDLIYNYENELKRIMQFLNFKEKDHINKKTRFNPDISIKNTQLFRKKIYEKEIKILENELKEYLYDFKETLDNDVLNTVEFE